MESVSVPTKTSPEGLPAIWAIDPSEKELRPDAEAVESLNRFLGGSFSEVHPLFVYTDEEGKERAQELLAEYIKPLALDPLGDADIIHSSSQERSAWIDQVLLRAQLRRARILLMMGHGRSVVGDFFLGGFTSDLLHKSPIPLFFIAPHNLHSDRPQKMLFATDLSDDSLKAFQDFVSMAQGKVSDLILFYALDFHAQGLNGADKTLHVTQEEAEDRLAQWAQKAGPLPAELNLIHRAVPITSSITESILQIAENENTFVVGLTSHVGPIANVVLGGVTQNLIAARKVNLCVYGPNFTGTPKNVFPQ